MYILIRIVRKNIHLESDMVEANEANALNHLCNGIYLALRPTEKNREEQW